MCIGNEVDVSQQVVCSHQYEWRAPEIREVNLDSIRPHQFGRDSRCWEVGAAQLPVAPNVDAEIPRRDHLHEFWDLRAMADVRWEPPCRRCCYRRASGKALDSRKVAVLDRHIYPPGSLCNRDPDNSV